MKEASIVQEIDINLLREARIARPTLRDTKAEKFLSAFNAAHGKHVFNDYVKKGMDMAWKAGGKEWEEVEVYGNEDVAYGIKLVMGDIKISIKESSIIKAVFRSEDEKKEIT